MNTTEQIRSIVASITSISTEIPPEANLYLDVGVASVYAVRLLTELEKSFKVSIPDDDFVDATSIAKLTELIDSLIKQQSEEAARA
jgi:acyl carrier protein